MIQALEQVRRHPPDRSYRAPVGSVIADITAGSTFSDGLQRCGRLDSTFRLLSSYYAERARLARQMIGDLAYPAFLLHFAVFILPFAQFFTSGNWQRYLTQVLGVLLPIYAVVALMVYAAQSRHGERWRALLEALLHPVPMLGQARRDLALGRLAGALEALLNAGITIIEAWDMAARACGSPALRRVVVGWRPLLDGGQTPAEALTASGRFPNLFASQYAAGEISGQLDETLRRLHAYYLEEGSRKLHAVSRWVPRFVYLCIVIAIACKIVGFYMNYFSMVRDAGGF